MHRKIGWSVALLLIGLAGPAMAADGDKPVQPPAQEATEGESAADRNGTSAIIPDVMVQEAQVEDLIEFIQKLSPKFRAMVVRRPNAEVPAITMKLKNVSVGQIMEILSGSYGVEVNLVEGPKGAIHVLTLPTAQPDPNQPPAAPERGVRVYRLGEIVERLTAEAGKDATPKQAMENVMSLIKATLEMAGSREAPVIKYHEETRTLIVRGSSAQLTVLEDVLAALGTNKVIRPGRLPDAARAQLDEARERAEAAGRAAENQVDVFQRRLRMADEEMQVLRHQLAEREKMLLDMRARLDHAPEPKKAQ